MPVYEYIKGQLTELSPTEAIVEQAGIGYNIQISLHSYTQIQGRKEISLFIHEIIREDTYDLFGFFGKDERALFRFLISVSGVGANTARMMLSSLSPEEIKEAILKDDVSVLKRTKGIGARTAERIIVDLRDKLGKLDESVQFLPGSDNTIRQEALSALIMLGFGKTDTAKVIDKLLLEKGKWNVELLVKAALKKL
ncbi:MAG: Holliday junction branch migration protein RuvA [Bacteroidales bacterium]|nr:Holliday junction branch migration protein RuvA [Bacteroidales bacterium]